MRRPTLFGLLVFGLAQQQSAGAQCVDYADYLHWAGAVWTRSALAIEIAGQFAFVADGVSGLAVVDISDPSRLRHVRSLQTPDAAIDLALAGKRAYVLDGLGLSIFDVTEPSQPSLLGRVELPPSAAKSAYASVAIVGDFAFVLRDGSRWVIDVRDPAHAFAVASDRDFAFDDVEVQDGYLYGLHGDELWVYDLADPIRPRLTAAYSGGNQGRDLCVVGDLAYIVGDTGLSIFDIAIPWRPLRLSNLQLSQTEWSRAVDVVGARAVVLDEEEVVLVDVTDPRAPEVLERIGSEPTHALNPTGIAISGDHVFFSHSQPGLVGVSAGRVTALALGGGRELAPISPRLPIHFESVVSGSNLYGVGHDALGSGPQFRSFDLSDPAAPVALGSVSLEIPEAVQCPLALIGPSALVVLRPSSGSSELVLLEISDPAQPLLVDRLAGDFMDVAVDGDRAVVTLGAAGLAVLDLSVPGVLGLAGIADTPGSASGVQLVGELAFVADGSAGLSLVDVSDPLAPSLQTTIASRGSAVAVDVVADVAWLAEGAAGLTAIAWNGAGSPQILGSWPTAEYVNDVDVRGAHAYVVEQGVGLHLLSIVDPTAPELIGGVALAQDGCGPGWVTLAPQALILNDGCLGAATFSLACEGSVPLLLRDFELSSRESGIRVRWTVVGDEGALEFRLLAESEGRSRALAFHASDQGGYEAWDSLPRTRAQRAYALYARHPQSPWQLLARERFEQIPSTQTVKLLGAQPNPFNPSTTIAFELARASQVELAIFDLSGRRVRTLLRGEWLAAGSQAVSWDGSDDRGRAVVSGVYVCRLVADGQLRSQRITLLK